APRPQVPRRSAHCLVSGAPVAQGGPDTDPRPAPGPPLVSRWWLTCNASVATAACGSPLPLPCPVSRRTHACAALPGCTALGSRCWEAVLESAWPTYLRGPRTHQEPPIRATHSIEKHDQPHSRRSGHGYRRSWALRPGLWTRLDEDPWDP